MTAEQLVAASVLHEQAGDGAVPEVEHEAGALVAVVEEIRLAARGDDEDRVQLVLCKQHVACNAESDRRAAGDVVVLDGVRA